MCVEESVHIIFNEFDNFNSSKQVDDFEIVLVRSNEKDANSIEEEGLREERRRR